MKRRQPASLETVFVEVPAEALEAYEAALAAHCLSIGLFFNEDADTWRIEGVRAVQDDDDALAASLIVAEFSSGFAAPLSRVSVAAEGWLARNQAAFPEQQIGRRFCIRGSHVHAPKPVGRITLTLDAGLAFGSGEHGSTRGCLRALETVAYRKPRAVLDLGTGSGVLAIAAGCLLRRRVLASDIEPLSVRETSRNAARNGVSRYVRPILADGWHNRTIQSQAPFDLVLANILARPLAFMAKGLASHLAPGGTAILAGLLRRQTRMVLAAHRRHGLTLERVVEEGPWVTLVLRAPARTFPKKS